MKKFHTGLIGLSGDPITFGHLDLIAKAAEQCDKLFVVIANNEQKLGHYLFNLDERIRLTSHAIQTFCRQDILNIFIVGLAAGQVLADFYLEHDCDVMFRGVRNPEDVKYEQTQIEYHKLILPSINVEFIFSRQDLRLVSSTMAKNFVGNYLDVYKFVPMAVKQILEEKLLGQYKIGITGGMSVGKSWVADQLGKHIKEQCGIDNKVIKLDDLIAALYAEQTNGAHALRQEIVKLTGPDVLVDDVIKKDVLAKYVFGPDCIPGLKQGLEILTTPHINRLYRDKITGFKGLIIFEWAQLAEMSMGHWVNNNVIVVDSPDRDKLIANRGLDLEVVRQRALFQWSAQMKIEKLLDQSVRDGHGKVIPFQNKFGTSDIKFLVEEILKLRKIK